MTQELDSSTVLPGRAWRSSKRSFCSSSKRAEKNHVRSSVLPLHVGRCFSDLPFCYAILIYIGLLDCSMAFPNKENKSDGLAQAIGPLDCRRKCLVVLMPTSPLWAKSQSQYFYPINNGIPNSYANSWINFSHLEVTCTANSTFIFSSSKAMGSPMSFRVGHGTWPRMLHSGKMVVHWLQRIAPPHPSRQVNGCSLLEKKRKETKRQDRNETKEDNRLYVIYTA